MAKVFRLAFVHLKLEFPLWTSSVRLMRILQSKQNKKNIYKCQWFLRMLFADYFDIIQRKKGKEAFIQAKYLNIKKPQKNLKWLLQDCCKSSFRMQQQSLLNVCSTGIELQGDNCCVRRDFPRLKATPPDQSLDSVPVAGSPPNTTTTLEFSYRG